MSYVRMGFPNLILYQHGTFHYNLPLIFNDHYKNFIYKELLQNLLKDSNTHSMGTKFPHSAIIKQ